jgi:hypothetical protein
MANHDDRYAKYRRDHAISDEVWRKRPYLEYRGPESREKARKMFPPDEELAPNQISNLSKSLNWLDNAWKNQSNDDPGGFVFARTPPPRLPPITPQWKAWQPEPTRKRVAYHGPETDEQLLNPETHKPLHAIQIKTPHESREHIGGRWHKGTNRNDVHVEQEDKKYSFLTGPSAPYPWDHTHRKMFEAKDGSLEAHLRKWKEHKGQPAPDVDEPHTHMGSRTDPGDAKRIDMHRLAEPLFAEAKIALFGFEGTVKGDSMLSYVLDPERRMAASVLTTPSVTTWDCPELREVAERYLLDKLVFLVVDADGRTNPDVWAQALLARTRLDQLGVRVVVAAPPLALFEQTKDTEGEIKGVDDYLAAKHLLEELEVWDHDAPEYEIAAWAAAQKGERTVKNMRRQLDRRTRQRMARVLYGLSLHGDAQGSLALPLRTFARVVGVSPWTVPDALFDLEARGVIKIDGRIDLVKRWGKENTPGKWYGKKFYPGLDWQYKPPLVTILDPALRASSRFDRRIKDVPIDEKPERMIDPMGIVDGQSTYAAILRRAHVPTKEVTNMTLVSERDVRRIEKTDTNRVLSVSQAETAFVSNRLGQSWEFRFRAERGERYQLVLTNSDPDPVRYRVEGPSNRQRPILCEDEMDGRSGVARVLTIKNKGEHTCRLLPGSPTGDCLVTIELRPL